MVSKRKIIALLIGIIIAGAVIICSNSLDSTRSIDYAEKPSLPYIEANGEDNRTVYICTDRSAQLYHFYKDCDELLKCTRDIDELKLSDAEKAGRLACTICRQ